MLSLKLYMRVVCISDFPILYVKHTFFLLCFVDHASRYNHVKRNQLDAQLILSTLSNQDNSHLKRLSTNCCIRTVVPPDDGPRYTQNM